MTTLLTGATGSLGIEIAKSHVNENPNENLYVLLRGKDSDINAKIKAIRKHCGRGKIVAVRGDITKVGTGISKKAISELSEKVNGIIHCAADVDFSTGLIESMDTNLEGTRNIVVLLEMMKNLERFGYVSTAFVSGKRRGRILEKELEHKAGFINPYERTKYDTERFLSSLKGNIKVAIYRPSIMPSNSKGTVMKFHALHKALELYYHDLLSYVPGKETAKINMVTTDFAADTIVALYERFSQKKFHICSTEKKSYSYVEFLNESGKLLNKNKPKSPRSSQPKIVSELMFNKILEKKRAEKDLVNLRIMESLRKFAVQMEYPKIFDTANVKNALGNSWEEKHPQEYFGKAIDFCVRNKWGK